MPLVSCTLTVNQGNLNIKELGWESGISNFSMLEPKIVGLGLAIRVSMFAKIRYKDLFFVFYIDLGINLDPSLI